MGSSWTEYKTFPHVLVGLLTDQISVSQKLLSFLSIYIEIKWDRQTNKQTNRQMNSTIINIDMRSELILLFEV